MKFLIILLSIAQIGVSSLMSHASEQAKSCSGVQLALLLDHVSQYDSIHNCSVNISANLEYEEEINSKNLIKKYKIEVQDQYQCQRDPSACKTELFEFKISQSCLEHDNLVRNNFHYSSHFDFGGYIISKYFKVKFDYFDNLIHFELGEFSNQYALQHRIICQPTIFGVR